VSVVAPPPPVDRPSRRRRTGARLLHLLAWAGVLGLTGMAVLRLFGVDGSALTAGLLSLTPYAAAAGPVVLVVAALARARVAVAVTVALIALNVVWLVPRYTAEHLPAATAPRLRVMSANLYFGDADPGSVVAAVRAQRPDVLTLIEVDRAGLAALDRAGLAGLLPHRIVRFAPGAGGTAILSRLGLRDLGEAGPTAYRSPRALVFVGDRVVAVQAVHTRPPIPGPTVQWRRDLALLAGPRPSRSGYRWSCWATSTPQPTTRRSGGCWPADCATPTTPAGAGWCGPGRRPGGGCRRWSSSTTCWSPASWASPPPAS
jgi:hypothetical protein